jgi:hypothetical protein
MSLHTWLGRHAPDLLSSHWDRGQFVTGCAVCGQTMVKLPGLGWQLRGAGA